MRRVFKVTSWLPDLVVCAGIVLGVVILLAPRAVGLDVTYTAGEFPESDLKSVSAPWFLLPMIGLVIMWGALRASTHAEAIAHRLRDPFGALTLTLSGITIELVLVIAVMMTGRNADTVARDTMFATLMMILNGLVGVALVAGAIKRREQAFNQQSSGAYLSMIAALCTIGLVLPRFTTSEPGGYMSDSMEVFVAGASLAVYIAFIALQSSAHRDFFVMVRPVARESRVHSGTRVSTSVLRRTILLICSLVCVILLADSLGDLLVNALRQSFLPVALQGVVIALLILLPEGITAIRSALGSDLQRTINILHGSALSTIGLTIPAVLIVGRLIGTNAELGLEAPEITLLTATILVSTIQFGQGRTNLMHGLVHVMLFMLWIALLTDSGIESVSAPAAALP
ncbi:MAG: hypothetical protein EXS03_03900 [Phycisphaerales bacterium]|nr:hypothetical protein [Phycisphaerales bacterium]